MSTEERKNGDRKPHAVLIVDDEEKVGRSAGAALKKINARYVYASSGKEGLEWIKTAASPFSLILSDQHLPDMEGSDFFAVSKKMAPDTLRYLIASHADIEAVTRAVNLGSIHRFIAKPWIEKEFIGTVKMGLEQFDLTMENHHLFKQAKEQNEKLYQLNMDLNTNSAKFKKAIAGQEQDIRELNRILEKGFENRNHVREIGQMVREKKMLAQKKTDILCRAVISELFEQFRDIAVRHGFEMGQGEVKDER